MRRAACALMMTLCLMLSGCGGQATDEVDQLTLDIRGEYFKGQWTSDFCIRFTDGTTGVRELVSASGLTRRSEVEKLELSRRYWAALRVSDWRIVIAGK